MKILQAIASLETGGAQKLVSEISPLLRDCGHQVDVVVFNGKESIFTKNLTDEEIEVMSLGRSSVYNPINIWKLTRLSRHYDVVHTHTTAPQLFAAVAFFFADSTVLVTTEHNTSNRRRNHRIFRPLDIWMYGRYKKVICISEKTKEALDSYLKPTKVDSIVIENGLNLENYRSASPLSSQMNSGKFIVTMVALFRYQKDQETLIRAFRLLDANRFELWLIGDGERRSVIEKCIEECGLESVVKLWGIRKDVPSIMAASNVIVQSSHIDGFALSAVEGMAAGKPVIASDIPGLAQVVGDAGILFPHQDYEKLAEEIQRLADFPDKYDEVAKRCAKRAEEFTIQKMVNKYDAVYQELVPNERI